MLNSDPNTYLSDTPESAPEPKRASPLWIPPVQWQDALTVALLLVILSTGYWLRSVGRNWDDGTHLHPDERFMTDVASKVGDWTLQHEPERIDNAELCLQRYPRPTDAELDGLEPEEQDRLLANAGKGGYFDARCSDLNPNNIGFGLYVYGEFPMFTTRTTAEAVVSIEEEQCLDDVEAQKLNKDEAQLARETCRNAARRSPHTSYSGVNLIGRLVSSLADTLTILLVFLTGYQLFGRWQGLLGAALYAFAVFPIQLSHFWTADAFTGAWVMLAMYAAVNVLDDHANRRSRYFPLAWLTAAVALWVWDLPHLDSPTLAPLLIYLAAMAIVGITSIWARELNNPRWLAVGLGVGLIPAVAGNDANLVTLPALVGALGLMLLLAGLTFFGLSRITAYSGNFPWIMAAFGLWIYDSLANYDRASLSPLLIYLIIFTIGAVLGSALKSSTRPEHKLVWLATIGGSLLAWIGLVALLDGISWEGALAALVLVGMMSAGTAFGYRDYLAFGLAFGGALAGRVNVAPLVGVLLLAMLIRYLPIFDRQLLPRERYRLTSRAILGLLIAGFFTILAFRFMQPHAFTGPSILGLSPYEGWKEDIGVAQRLVSGDDDSPPNHQWGNRVRWMYPWQNMVIYGFGPALGLAAWIGVLWALWIIVRGKRGWTRLALPMAWIAVYFGWLGGNWVTTMRYFLPIYGSLAVIAAWMLSELIQRTVIARLPENITPTRERLRSVAAGLAMLLLIFVVGYTMLYGYAFTSIPRHLLTRVAASLWIERNLPSDIGLWIEREDGSLRLQNINTNSGGIAYVTVPLTEAQPVMMPLSIATPVRLESVVLHRVTDPSSDPDPEQIRVRILRVQADGITQDVLAERILTQDFSQGSSDFGIEYSVSFEDENLLLEPPDPAVTSTPPYQVELALLEGDRVILTRNVGDNVLPMAMQHVSVYLQDVALSQPLILYFPLDPPRNPDQPETPYTYYQPNQTMTVTFTAEVDGTIQTVEFPHIADPLQNPEPETVRVQISGSSGSAIGEVTQNFATADDGFHQHGYRTFITLDQPLSVKANELYTLIITPDSPITTLGTVIANEGPWDDAIPYSACLLPNEVELNEDTPSGYTDFNCENHFSPYTGFYKGTEMVMAMEDDATTEWQGERLDKRDYMIEIMSESDYLTISSNRFYDSFRRIPYRWPMSRAYYDALFGGELGFELVQTFESYARVGKLVWKDQVLPSDDLPDWLNEFESEEAFSVYDHPTVFIFRKTTDFDPEKVREILYSVPLRRMSDVYGGISIDSEPVNRAVVTAKDATEAPTLLMMNEADREANRRGTFRKIFDPQALVNQSDGAAVIIWWLLMVAVGWLTFPMMFAIFPALPNRGFEVSKLVGWLLVAWLAWLGASLHLGTWSQGGILLCIVFLGMLSAGFAWSRRQAIGDYVRDHWLHLLSLELLSLVLFMIFVGVRLGNPDLWHSSFGGEKPMNFAYFNGVLRSEVFPPLDPWYSGGYINYYYWGYVLVGAPTKLLGLLPAVAYNLIIPTMFSMTGMGAFSIAYNLIAARQNVAKKDDDLRRAPRANPWVAGMAALLLVAVLGNQDTVRVFVDAVARVGEWNGPTDVHDAYREELMLDFREEYEREPSLEELAELTDQVENPSLWFRWKHGVGQFTDMISGFTRGIGKVMDGEPLPIHTHRWYWMPTRILAELPADRGHGAIVEFPYFTFLYGDLHAHMIAMPVQLLIMLWLAAEILGAGRGLRGRWAAGMALILGAMSVGMLQAINTWDWPTYMILGIAGLTFAAWIGQERRQMDVQRGSTYYRLRNFLDLRRALALWWLLWAFPLGMALHGGNFIVKSAQYETALDEGKVPLHCQSISDEIEKNGDYPGEIPDSCDGFIKPLWTASGSMKWGIGALGGVVFLYMAALVFFGARFEQRGFLGWIGRLTAFGIIAILAALPYTWYNASEGEIEAWKSDRTPLWAFIDIHALFLFILTAFLLWQTARRLKQIQVREVVGYSLPITLLLLAVPVILIAALGISVASVPIALVTLPMITWAAILFLVPGTSHVERVVYALMTLALGIATGVEMVRLNVDIGRQNTVFKFYMEVWLMLGVSSGIALAWLMYAIYRWRPLLRSLFQIPLGILLTVAALFPVLATQARWIDRFNAEKTPMTLNGQAYMDYAIYGQRGITYNLAGDYAMIRWLEGIEGTPNIIEAQGYELYQWTGRISINTGLPTVIGWNFHQRQQRAVLNLNTAVWSRGNNVDAFYTLPDIASTWNLIEFYDIEYIIVGTVEHVLYNNVMIDPGTGQFLQDQSAGIVKFERMVEMGLLEKAYEEPTCMLGDLIPVSECPPDRIVPNRVYRVVPSADYDMRDVGR